MTTVTLITRADVHVADHAPEMRCDDWRTTIMGKLRQINGLAQKHKCAAILDAGDLFYIKSPFKNSHGLVRDLIQLHGEAPCPTFAIAGNHDIKHDNLTTLSGQPLGVLFESGALKPMEGGVWLKDVGPSGVHSTDDYEKTRIWLVGIPYSKQMSAMDLDIEIPTNPKPLAVVAVVHFFAQPKGGDFFGTPTLSYEDLAELYPEVTAWVFGHWHKDQGIHWIGKVPFINVGAVSRGALREENLKRKPKSGLIRLDFNNAGQVQVEAEEIELEIEPPEKVFRIEEKARIEQRIDVIRAFAETMKAQAEVAIDDDGVEVAAAQLLEVSPDEVRVLAERYLLEAGVPLGGA